ncbi:type II toxin-antitoxin system VapC family toxin [Acidovorax sp. YS12]|jgi:tRNA(fMet)-specific endonuclease VapC|nr:type II toxin-antitoxin system VapC family toxin [Acidovorax sp. YS12]
MPWLFDTNILIAISKRHPALLSRLERIDSSAVMLSSVVLAEIEYGIAKSARKQTNRLVFDAIIETFTVHRFDEAAAREFGALRAHLETQGQVIGPYDMMIAAQALALGATLVTDNEREFRRVPGLAVENWLRG